MAKNDGVELENNTMKSNVNKIEQEISNLRNVNNDFNNISETLSNAWKGEEATKFINEFKDTFTHEYKSTIENFEEYTNYLNDVLNKYETLENNFASKNIS